tara:strand:- start:3487 stop:3840 length:354 start_codon:yes stop_codon:yes gene_type:complete
MDLLKNRAIKENDAVMFDIDDTLIFTNGKLNEPIVNLLHYSKSLGYKIVIITARPHISHVVQYTTKQLNKHNIPYDILGFSPARQKGEMKRTIGYNFILSVGDMPTDLTDTLYGLMV